MSKYEIAHNTVMTQFGKVTNYSPVHKGYDWFIALSNLKMVSLNHKCEAHNDFLQWRIIEKCYLSHHICDTEKMHVTYDSVIQTSIW